MTGQILSIAGAAEMSRLRSFETPLVKLVNECREVGWPRQAESFEHALAQVRQRIESRRADDRNQATLAL